MSESGESILNCPHCEQPIQVEMVDAEQLLLCPHCQGDFTVPVPGYPGRKQDMPDLDGLRIRKISRTRMAAYRSRSWCLIGMIVFATGAIQLIIEAFRAAGSRGIGLTFAIDLIGAAACILMAIHLLLSARRISQEIRNVPSDEPSEPPDFSTLSDGSQHWRNLEQMSADPPPPEKQ